MAPPTKEEQSKRIQLHTLVGEYLAQGFTNNEILSRLQQEQGLTVEEARSTLREVFDSWTSVRDGLNLQSEDDSNWHQYMRMRLLREAVADKSTPSQRLALQILDSLATIQGISTTTQMFVPLSIELVEKEPEAEAQPEAEPES